MACDDGYGARHPPMCHRNSPVARHGNRGGHPRNHLIGNPLFLQVQNLFPAPAEYKTVPALQTDYPFTRPGLKGQQPMNLLLAVAVLSHALSHIDPFTLRPCLQEKILVNQIIVHHHIGLLQGAKPFYRNQIPSAARSH